MYTWTVKTGERYWSVWLDWEKIQKYLQTSTLHPFTSFQLSWNEEVNGEPRGSLLVSIPFGKATFLKNWSAEPIQPRDTLHSHMRNQLSFGGTR